MDNRRPKRPDKNIMADDFPMINEGDTAAFKNNESKNSPIENYTLNNINIEKNNEKENDNNANNNNANNNSYSLKTEPKAKRKRKRLDPMNKAYKPKQKLRNSHANAFNLLVGKEGHKTKFINTEGKEEDIRYTYVVHGTSESTKDEKQLYNFRRKIADQFKSLVNFTEAYSVSEWSQNKSPWVLSSYSGKKKFYRADSTTFNYTKGLRVTLFSNELSEAILNHGGKTVVPYSEEFARVEENLEFVKSFPLFITAENLAKASRQNQIDNSRNQNNIMGDPAKNQAAAAELPEAKLYHWCHSVGHSILARLSQVSLNLNAGHKYANADMLKGDKPVPKISKLYPKGFHFNTTAYVVLADDNGNLKPTQLGYKVVLEISAEPDLYIQFEFYMQRITPPQKSFANAVAIVIDEKLNLIAHQRKLDAAIAEGNIEKVAAIEKSYNLYDPVLSTPLNSVMFSPANNELKSPNQNNNNNNKESILTANSQFKTPITKRTKQMINNEELFVTPKGSKPKGNSN